MRRAALLALALVLLVPVPAPAQLTSRSHILTPFYEVLWRSRAVAGETFFSLYMRNLQGSDPANPGEPYDLLGGTENGSWTTWEFYGPMYGYDDGGPFVTRWYTYGVRGNTTVWGSVYGMGDTQVHFEEQPDGSVYYGTQFYPMLPPTYLFGCDVPAWAYTNIERYGHGGGGYYQTCGHGGTPGWFTLEWANAGSWTLNDLRVYAPPGLAPTDVSVSPEPVSMALLGTGLLGIGAAARRRRRERLEVGDPA